MVDAMEELLTAVLRDPALRRRLLAVPERQPFLDAVTAIGDELGLSIDACAVEEALVVARRAWLATWV